MKKFKVPIKKHISDFICTQNIWLTINDHDVPLYLAKQDSSHEILLAVSHDDIEQGSGLVSQCVDSNQPSREFKRTLKENKKSADFILMDTKKHNLEYNLNSQAYWVLFRRNTGEIEILSDGHHTIKLEKDNFLVAFYSVSNENVLQTILDASLALKKISISQFKAILKICGECDDCTTPLLLINYTTSESYSFSIKSTLNAVSLTIDMIKNKVTKYHREKLWQIETVLHEALVNAITYGNELDDSRLVNISYEIGYKGIRIWVRDMGDGFDVKNISVPVGDEALDRISGRGIYIMKKFTEALYFNQTGNEILLYFDF